MGKRNCCKATTYYIPLVANLNKEKKLKKNNGPARMDRK